ncbi:UPF0415 protein C7orf25 [Sergentomyia squamirostris]
MSQEKSPEDLTNLVKEKLNLGEDLLKKLETLRHVNGVPRLEKKIKQEINFLKNNQENSTLQENHIMCTNLTHFQMVVAVLMECRSPKHIDLPLVSTCRSLPLRVDIVCDGGLSWLKIIARKSKSIEEAVSGMSKYGLKNILDQAEEFVEVAAENPVNFQLPKIYFVCLHPLDDDLVMKIQQKGVVVKNFSLEDKNFSTEEKFEDMHKVLNLDITTLLAYVSSLTNGSCDWIFTEPVLTDQAISEQKNPVKVTLERIFDRKQLICCETAEKCFREIVDMLGGPAEKQRTEDLMQRVKVLPDVTEVPDRWKNIRIRGKIKPRSFQIFIFGQFHGALTVTSNEGFIRAVKTQEGIDIPAFVHEARALTEMKENSAKKVIK